MEKTSKTWFKIAIICTILSVIYRYVLELIPYYLALDIIMSVILISAPTLLVVSLAKYFLEKEAERPQPSHN